MIIMYFVVETPESSVNMPSSPESFVVSVGLAIPSDRFARGSSKRSVARADEDAITLAVEACGSALAFGPEPATLILASTTPAYDLGGNTQPLVEMLGLPGHTSTIELTSGDTDALVAIRMATVLTSSGSGPVMVVASNSDRNDPSTGDGAVAMVFVDQTHEAASEPIMTVRHLGSHTEELRDEWRPRGQETTVRADRSFVSDIGTINLGEKFAGGYGGSGPVMVCSVDQKAAAKLEERLGGPGDRLQKVCGVVGAAHPLLRAISDIEEASTILSLSGGRGEAIELVPGEGISHARSSLSAELGKETIIERIPSDQMPADFDPYTSIPRAWRERGRDLRLEGILPESDSSPARERRTGEVVSFTTDFVYPGTEPVSMAVVEINGGGRFFGQVATGEKVSIGEEVTLVPRRLHSGGGMVQWFWKVAPCR